VNRFPGEENLAAIRGIGTTQNLDERALTRSVITDETDNLSGVNLKVDPAEGDNRSKVFVYCFSL
jgi:hypothetical protein